MCAEAARNNTSLYAQVAADNVPQLRPSAPHHTMHLPTLSNVKHSHSPQWLLAHALDQMFGARALMSKYGICLCSHTWAAK